MKVISPCLSSWRESSSFLHCISHVIHPRLYAWHCEQFTQWLDKMLAFQVRADSHSTRLIRKSLRWYNIPHEPEKCKFQIISFLKKKKCKFPSFKYAKSSFGQSLNLAIPKAMNIMRPISKWIIWKQRLTHYHPGQCCATIWSSSNCTQPFGWNIPRMFTSSFSATKIRWQCARTSVA